MRIQSATQVCMNSHEFSYKYPELQEAAESAKRSTGTVNWQATRYRGSTSEPMLRQCLTLAEAYARFFPSPNASSTLSNPGDSCETKVKPCCDTSSQSMGVNMPASGNRPSM